MKLSVIIVNYKVKHYLEQCLRSVAEASRGIAVEVIVVDNASGDGSVEYLRERFPDVTIIASEENLGFARANNLAIRNSHGQYVLLLNPDTIVAEETFSDFISFMDSTPDAGGCGAYMLHTDGSFAPESRRGLPTPFVAFCKMSGLASLFPKSRTLGRYYMRYLNENEVNRIEIMSGAFMFLRRDALDKAGLLDEDFFMYGEDIDLSYRILKAGYNNYFLPSRILHYKGESTVKSSYRYVHTFYRAMELFFNKHYAHYSILLSLPIKLAIWGRAMLAYAGNQFKHRNELTQHLHPINCLVIGNSEATEQVRAILTSLYGNCRHTFVTGNSESLPQGHLSEGISLEGYDTVVYDTGAYSYGTILELLSREGTRRLSLGTYSADTRILITDGAIHSYNEKTMA
jgi:GT2 family glycosyltransferase